MSNPWIDSGVTLHLFAFDQHLLGATLVLAGFVSAILLALAIIAVGHRRSWPYLLVAAGLATLLVRTVVGFLTLGALIDPMAHHILEHGLDVLAVVLLLGAIYLSRTVERGGGGVRE